MEYPAMIYKYNRNKGYVANCISKNMIGFGKTEDAAIKNLKESLQNCVAEIIVVRPIYGISLIS